MAARSPKIVILAERRRNASESLSGPLEGISLHLDSLYRTARLLTGSDAAAEDLVQETAIRAWRGWTSLRSFTSLKPWLLQILHRTFLNTVRAELRRPPLLGVAIDELLSHPVLSVQNEESWQAISAAVLQPSFSLSKEGQQAPNLSRCLSLSRKARIGPGCPR